MKLEPVYSPNVPASVSVGADSEYLTNALQNLKVQSEALSSKQGRLLDTFVGGQIDKALYDQKIQELQNEATTLNQEIRILESRKPENTLEPVKNLFLKASRAKKEFLDGDDQKKREVVESLLWNLSIQHQDMVKVSFKSPYHIMYKAPKDEQYSELLAVWYEVGTNLNLENTLTFHNIPYPA